MMEKFSSCPQESPQEQGRGTSSPEVISRCCADGEWVGRTLCSSSWWKPSSHRNPRGKKLRDGTALSSDVEKDCTSQGPRNEVQMSVASKV